MSARQRDRAGRVGLFNIGFLFHYLSRIQFSSHLPVNTQPVVWCGVFPCVVLVFVSVTSTLR
jgi:hypothetical protein